MTVTRIETVAVVCMAICSLLPAQSPTAGVRLQAGIAKEDVDGDLPAAIAIYQKIADDKSAPRDVRARALLRLAGCYEKLGREAEQVYQQVAREYADQPAAAQARTRLAALRQAAAPVSMTQRKIEPPGDAAQFTLNTDGRRAIYRDGDGNTLVISDLDGRNKRVIYKAKPGELSGYIVASRDLSMVMVLLGGAEGKVTRFVIKSDGTGYRELGDRYLLSVSDWSWDNRYLVYAGVGPPSDTAGGVVVVSVADGKAREVVRRDASVYKARLSPDGHFIAFGEGQAGTNRVFVMPVEGGEPRLVTETTSDLQLLLDWTADGRFLAITSHRSGADALYLFPVKDGQPSGEPVFVRYGSFLIGTSHPNGSLVFSSVRTGSQVAMLASLDSNGGLGAWKSLDLNIAGNGTFFAAMQWSPDSAQFLYLSRHDDAGQSGAATRIRDIGTGQDREVYRSATNSTCRWEARLPNLLCLNVNGSTEELSLVALDSGRVERLGSITLAADFYNDALAGLAREKGFEPVPTDVVGILGYDALVRVVNRNLELRVTKESDWRRLATLNSQPGLFEVAYSPHGVFFFDKDSAGKDGVFRIRLEGGQPERLGDAPPGHLEARFIHVSPDGRNVLVEGITNGGTETWLLENFVPKAPAAR